MPHRTPLFREILLPFLADYLRIVEPDSAAHLKLDQITLPDLGVPGWTDAEKQAFGVIAKVPSQWGEQVTLVIQVEPEALTPTELSRRLGRYFTDLEIHYCEPVLLSVLYLRGGRPGINLETAPVSRIFDMDLLRIYLTTFGLERARAEYYLERPEPLSWALSAAMQPVRHSRAHHRRLCLERIAAAGLAEEHRTAFVRFVDAFLEEESR